MNDINEVLEVEVLDQIERLSRLALGSKEHAIAVDDISKLYRLRVEEIKNEMDFADKEKRLKEETDLKMKQLQEQKVDRYWKTGTTFIVLYMQLLFYKKRFHEGLIFEQEGTFTSQMVKDLFGRFKSIK